MFSTMIITILEGWIYSWDAANKTWANPWVCRSAINSFMGRDNFLFVNQTSSEMILVTSTPPDMAKVNRKALIVIKARQDTREPGFPTGVQNEVVFMEMNKPVLDNLHNVCSVSPRRMLAHFASLSNSDLNSFVL